MPPRPAPPSPSPDATLERPALGWVSAFAAACFVLGVAWPFVARVDLVPRPPGSGRAEAPAKASSEGGDPSAEGGEGSGAVSNRQLVLLRDTVVVSCHDARGTAIEQCDQPPLGEPVETRLLALADCAGAQGARGVLSLGLNVDFERRRIAELRSGKSTSLPNDVVDALLACARSELANVSLADVPHAHAEYWIYHRLELVPPGTRVEAEHETPDSLETEIELVKASGHATVGWNTAVVRETPAKEAPVAARLTFGTRVRVTGRQGDWYRVVYDAKGRVGWVHRSEVGL